MSRTCPACAIGRWLRRARITRGPVLRGITAHGTIEGRLSADGGRKILLRRAAQVRLTVHPSERLSPHGLRAGLITEAYLAGAPDEQVMQHTRHADLSTMRGYRRRARVTADNPARPPAWPASVRRRAVPARFPGISISTTRRRGCSRPWQKV